VRAVKFLPEHPKLLKVSEDVNSDLAQSDYTSANIRKPALQKPTVKPLHLSRISQGRPIFDRKPLSARDFSDISPQLNVKSVPNFAKQVTHRDSRDPEPLDTFSPTPLSRAHRCPSFDKMREREPTWLTSNGMYQRFERERQGERQQ
jgi:hypothetical protein